MAIIDDIRKLTKQLFPTGLVFRVLPNTWKSVLINALTKSENRAYERIYGISYGLLPDNDNFTVQDAEEWENTLDISNVSGLTLDERKARIARKIAHPGGVLNRQSAAYLQAQLQAEGFTDVYVYDNRFGANNDTPESPNTQMKPLIDLQSGNFQSGQNQSGAYYPQQIITSLDSNVDDHYYWGENNLTPSFFISSDNIDSAAEVDSGREIEFRQLILKTKPLQTVAYLNVNFI